MTKQELKKLIAQTAAAYNVILEPARVNVYYEHLKDYTKEVLIRALEEIYETSYYYYYFAKFVPPPAKIIELIEKDAVAKATKALERLENLLSYYSDFEEPIVDDPIFVSAMRCVGGWIKLHDACIYGWEQKRQEFFCIYKSLLKYGRRSPKNTNGGM